MRVATRAHHSLLLLVFVAVLCAWAAPDVWGQAATLRGTVTDADTGETLIGANVAVEGTTLGTATDLDGRYAIPGVPAGAQTIRISYTGYQTTTRDVTLQPGETATLDVTLTAGVELDPVVVTGSRKAEKITDAPAAISVVQPREIEQQVGPSPEAALRNVTGIDDAQTGIDRREMVLRGFNQAFNGSIFVLTDYRQAAVASLGVNAYSLMPIATIDLDRIEVVRGPGSALYGAGADAGVVHFISKDPFLHPGTSVAVAGGQRGLFSGEARQAGVVNSRLGYKVVGKYARGDDWQLDLSNPVNLALIGQEVTPRDYEYWKYNIYGGLEYRLSDETQLAFNVGQSSFKGQTLSDIGTVQGDGFRYTYAQARLQAGNFFAQAYGNFNHEGDSFNYGNSTDPTCVADVPAGQFCPPLPVTDRGRLYVAQAQYNLDVWGGREALVMGVDVELLRPDTQGTIHGRNEGVNSIDEYGVYAQSTTEITPKLDLTLALRGDYNNVVEKVQVSPRAAVLVKPAAGHTFRATYNRAFSSPGTNSNFLDLVARNAFGIDVRARGAAFGFTFDRDPAYTALAGSDLVMSSLLPTSLGVDRPLGLDLGEFYELFYGGLAQFPLADIQAALAAEGLNLDQQTIGGLLALLAPDATQVEGFSQGTLVIPNLSDPSLRTLVLPNDIQDIPPLEQRTTQTFEVGYKGIFQNRVLLAIDAYYEQKKNFITPLRLETPLVAATGLTGDLTSALAAGIAGNAALAGALAGAGLTPEQAAALIVGLGTDQFPPQNIVGIVQLSENNPGVGQTPELALTYRNFGEIDYWGVEVGVEILATDRLSVFANGSYISDDFFDADELGESNPNLFVPLNAPKFRAKGGFAYSVPGGFAVNASARFVDSHRIESGPYSGTVDSYVVVDAGVGYDFARTVPGLRLDVQATNVLNHEHIQFVGAAEIGRLIMARLTYGF